MAGIEALANRIRERAEAEAEAIRAEALAEREKILAKAQARAGKEREAILNRAQTVAAEKKRRIIATAEMEARQEQLKAKEEMIDKAFDLALAKLRDLPAAEYQALLLPLVVAAAETGNEEFIVAAADRERLGPDFLARVNQQLVKEGKVGNLTYAQETRPLEGGFILRSGGVDNNYSFELILKLSRDELEQEVAAILFPAS